MRDHKLIWKEIGVRRVGDRKGEGNNAIILQLNKNILKFQNIYWPKKFKYKT